jgi:hypothetical protein
MVRVLLGLIKGAIVGLALGYGATRLGVASGPLAFATYAAVGFVVGLVGGKAFWRHETLWTPAIKGIVGAVICVGLYWVASKFLGGVQVALPAMPGVPTDRPLVQLPVAVAPILAVIYGIFVEVDDGERKPASTPPA